MKQLATTFLFFFFVLYSSFSQDFKFAFVTDTHIGASTAEEDLKRTVTDINSLPDLEFVLITGDITEMGTAEEIRLAQETIEDLKIPYYVLPGNHDTGWSESGGVDFIREFGYDKFAFEHKGFKFIGCASGPYVRMSDGHIPRDAIVWLDSTLATTPKSQPLIFVNHYPLDNSLDNWYEATDRLKNYNTQFAICGHGHRNKKLEFEGIPAAMGRSNLRAGAETGGYNIVHIKNNVALFSERIPGKTTKEPWRKIPLERRNYDKQAEFDRPSYAINDSFPQVKRLLEYHSDANVISTPVYAEGLVIFGNSTGKIEALSKADGNVKWTFKTGGGVFSSPAVFQDQVILGSGDGKIYSLNSATGDLMWKITTNASVLGSPIVQSGVVYIGGSDGKFRAIDAETGQKIWTFTGIEGPVVSTPLLHRNKVIFGAWDRHLYALNKQDGSLSWKWHNDSANRMFSPAMVTPVATDGIVFIVAPDRYLSAIDAHNGVTLWRTGEAEVRESLGISDDQSEIFAKTMNDTIVAFKTSRSAPEVSWKMNVGYGYDHVPSMLYEEDGSILFGTRNGIVYSIDPESRQINWAHKIDNSMVNSIRILDSERLLASTMDGKVVILTWKGNGSAE